MATMFAEVEPQEVFTPLAEVRVPEACAPAPERPKQRLTYVQALALAGLPLPQPETDAELAKEIRADLATEQGAMERRLLTTMLDIAEGRVQRPRARGVTSKNLIGLQAGISETDFYKAPFGAICDRYLDRLPGRGINMSTGKDNAHPMRARRTLMDVAVDWVMLLLENGDLMPAHSEGSSELSLPGAAAGMGIPRSHLGVECIKYLRTMAKVIGVGEPYLNGYSAKETERYRIKVHAWLDNRIANRLPLPCQAKHYGKVDHDAVLAANGPGPDIRMEYGYTTRISKARALVAPSPDGVLVDGPATFRSLRAAVKFWMKDGAAANWANISATLTKIRRRFDLEEDSVLPDSFHGAQDEFVVMATEGCGLEGKSLRSLQRWCEALHADAAKYVAMGGLPLPLWEAVALLVRKSGRSQRDIARDVGIGHMTLTSIVNGPTALLADVVDLFPKLEKVLDAPAGSLTARAGQVVRKIGRGTGCDEFLALDWRVRRLFPDGAEAWDGERVLAHAAILEKKVLRQDLPYGAIARAAQAMPPRPDFPPDMPIVEEYRLLKGHMVSPMPTDAKRHPKARWETAGTVGMMDRQVEDFALFALTPTALGGLGKEPGQVSLVLIFNWRNVAMWLNSRAGRHADLIHDGKPLGVAISDMDLQFISRMIGWMGSRYGWITQKREVFENALKVDEGTLGEPVNLRRLMIGKKKPSKEIKKLVDDFCSFAGEAVMPASLVQTARDNWKMVCVEAADQLANMVELFQRFKTRKRKVMKPIDAIVRGEEIVPLEWMARGVRRAIAAIPPMRNLYRHATAVRDVLVMILLITTALRSKNLRELRFFYEGEEACTDHGGVVTFKKDGVDVHIPWDQFKNRTSKELFGEFGDKQDYDKRIGDWLGLVPVFQHYVSKCLPELRRRCAESADRMATKVRPSRRKNGVRLGELTGSRTDDETADPAERENLLFPRGFNVLMDAVSLRDLVVQWTARFVVLDEATGLPIPGLCAFGPHAVRDVVATHVVLTSDDPARFEIAADLLQTSVVQVKTRYAFRDVSLRLAKSDRFYEAVNENFEMPKSFLMAA